MCHGLLSLDPTVCFMGQLPSGSSPQPNSDVNDQHGILGDGRGSLFLHIKAHYGDEKIDFEACGSLRVGTLV